MFFRLAPHESAPTAATTAINTLKQLPRSNHRMLPPP
ncbi:hypothetical protein F4555_001544 [Mobiluncus mulieris]|nr:hypothetical protein [Mobiluncus mulieris]